MTVLGGCMRCIVACCNCAVPNAVITIAIRLPYDYDPTTKYLARLLPFDARKK